MITREQFLLRVASLIELNVKPLDAFKHVFMDRVYEEYEQYLPESIFGSPYDIPSGIGAIVNVKSRLNYTIPDTWGDLRARGRGPVRGNIFTDFASDGGQTTSKMMLALLAGGFLDQAPVQLQDALRDAGLEPLPSGASDRAPLVSPRVEQEESLPDPLPAEVLDDDFEGILYDDLAD